MPRLNSSQRQAIQQRSTDAAGFRDVLLQFSQAIKQAGPAMLEDAAEIAFGSIVHGSPLTGAPGQPVESGALRDSWIIAREARGAISISSDSPYARVVEHNFRRVGRSQRAELRRARFRRAFSDALSRASSNPALARAAARRSARVTKAVLKAYRATLGGLQFRNGGPHSVSLTRRAWPRIAALAASNYGWDLLNG